MHVQVYFYLQSSEAFCTENEWGAALTSLDWHHVSINFDVTRKTGQLYRNGVLVRGCARCASSLVHSGAKVLTQGHAKLSSGLISLPPYSPPKVTVLCPI